RERVCFEEKRLAVTSLDVGLVGEPVLSTAGLACLLAALSVVALAGLTGSVFDPRARHCKLLSEATTVAEPLGTSLKASSRAQASCGPLSWAASSAATQTALPIRRKGRTGRLKIVA